MCRAWHSGRTAESDLANLRVAGVLDAPTYDVVPICCHDTDTSTESWSSHGRARAGLFIANNLDGSWLIRFVTGRIKDHPGT